jgi:polysaccharide biosynthesis transport protein
MENNDVNFSNYDVEDTKSIKDYLLLIRANLTPFIVIALGIIGAAVLYAIFAKNIYESTVLVKIANQQNNVLSSTSIPGVQDIVSDRFIGNEIDVINSYNLRERVAKVLIDNFNTVKNKNIFSLLLPVSNEESVNGHKTVRDLAELFLKKVTVEQERGIDIVDITADSPSPYEAALIVNTYAQQYKDLSLEVNREQLTVVRKFLEKQSKEKLIELNDAEDTLAKFQEKGGIVSLDAQSTALINQMSQLDTQRDATKIDLMASNQVLAQYKKQLQAQDPQLANYLESQTSQAYITVLQQQLAELQMNKDLALANKNSNIDVTQKVNEFDQKISEMKQKLTSKINDIKASAFASSPDQVKDLTQKLIEEEVNNHSLASKLQSLQSVISGYDKKFNKMPKTSIELARYERKRQSLEQLYLLVYQKYQEALINELSQPGYVVIINDGIMPQVDKPAKPNRLLIVLIGLILGPGLAFGFVLIKDYFDDTVKTPEDIEKNNINTIAWIPSFEMASNGTGKHEFILLEHPGSSASEAFRALRTRMQYSRVDAGSLKTILVTSAAPQDGKTVVSVNLAGSFAQSNKKTLLLDCDLRKPRIHNVMKTKKTPGLVDYLFNKAQISEVLRSSGIEGLSYIPCGTIPPNPSEILESNAMRSFLAQMREEYDIIIIDSAPIIAVTDSEILSRIVDGTLLVVSADKTEIGLMKNAVELIKNDHVPFLGTVLNNFKSKNGYGYYYKYYYYYSNSANGNGNGKKPKVKAAKT